MITSLLFKNAQGQLISELSNSAITVGISDSNYLSCYAEDSVILSLAASLRGRRPVLSDSSSGLVDGILTINQLSPASWNGNFSIYGSACTSIIDYTDTSDPMLTISNSHTLAIFDGCYPCSVCQKIAWLQNQLQNLQIWMQGMKDVNLQYQQAAAVNWQTRVDAKISNLNQQSCFAAPSTVNMDRSVIFGKAIKLLYQYKQAVAMWNYLVRTKTAHVQVISAPQDYSGFIVQSKVSFSTCSQQTPSTVRLHVTAILQEGQTASYLSQYNLGMGIYVGAAKQNTYIEYGKDSGTHAAQDFGQNISLTGITISGQPGIQATFVFTPTQLANTVFSGALKVLPAIYIKGYKHQSTDKQGQTQTYYSPSDSFVLFDDISGWNKERQFASQIAAQEQTQTNKWHINIQWSDSQGALSLQQDVYYAAAYGKYPLQQSSDSISQPEQEE